MEATEHKKLEFLEILARGTFGEVWIARRFEEGKDPEYVAVKLDRRDVHHVGGGVEQEFSTLKAIDHHPHIIEYKEFGKDVNRIFNDDTKMPDIISYLGLEFAPNKTILNYLLS